MLNCLGERAGFGDGITRRTFLRAGMLGLGGLTLGDVFQLRAAAGTQSSARQKSVIMIYLAGGPSHIDTFDMKPDAPVEVRGEFHRAPTKVPGMEFCDQLPKLASIADKLAVIRGVQTHGYHTGNEFFSGYQYEAKPNDLLRPSLGSVVSRVTGAAAGVPPYVSLLDPTNSLSTRATEWEKSAFLGTAHDPFRGFAVPNMPNPGLENLSALPEMNAARMSDRRSLLRSFDAMQRSLANDRAVAPLTTMNTRALDLITSNRVRDALDVSRADAKVRDRYYNPACSNAIKHHGPQFLQAARLVEAGVSVVTISIPQWDTHTANFSLLRKNLPLLDHCLHALLTDLGENGLLDDVAVLVAGEMGRTPRINEIQSNGGPGRDHWPQCGIALFAGGGLKTGQIIGSSDSWGAEPKSAPIGPQNLLATLYHVLGINPATTLPDANGRPIYLLDDRKPIAGLV